MTPHLYSPTQHVAEKDFLVLYNALPFSCSIHLHSAGSLSDLRLDLTREENAREHDINNAISPQRQILASPSFQFSRAYRNLQRVLYSSPFSRKPVRSSAGLDEGGECARTRHQQRDLTSTSNSRISIFPILPCVSKSPTIILNSEDVLHSPRSVLDPLPPHPRRSHMYHDLHSRLCPGPQRTFPTRLHDHLSPVHCRRPRCCSLRLLGHGYVYDRGYLLRTRSSGGE